jgi:SAM-dependent methyltransferase
MADQSHHWSAAAERYEQDFIDPYLPGGRNPLPEALQALAGDGGRTAADLGCGTGVLLPLLARQFRRVFAVDFAEGMLARARRQCASLANVEFLCRSLTDLAPLAGQVDVAVAVNSLIQPRLADLEAVLAAVRASLRPGGTFLGIVPAMDAVHYHTLLLLDRARQTGMPEGQARQNAARHGEHALYDFAFSAFHYRDLEQHFWQPFEIRYRLRRAGFRRVRKAKVRLSWEQFACAADLRRYPPPWDWFFQAEV